MPYRFVAHGGFVELELFGTLNQLEQLSDNEWSQLRSLGAVLYNYDGVEQIVYDPWVMAQATKRLAAGGIRIAAYAARPAWFGVNRQLLQIAELGEEQAGLFRDRAEAVAWLQFGSPRPE